MQWEKRGKKPLLKRSETRKPLPPIDAKTFLSHNIFCSFPSYTHEKNPLRWKRVLKFHVITNHLYACKMLANFYTEAEGSWSNRDVVLTNSKNILKYLSNKILMHTETKK